MKKILIASCAFILAIASGFFGARALANRNADRSEAITEVEASPVENSVEKPTPTPPSSDADTTDDGKTPVQYDGENPNSAEDLTAYFSVKRLENDKLTLRVNIDQYLSSGSCSLLVTDASGNLLVENSVEILPDASTSTCAGFDLSSPSLSSAEKPLTLTLTLSSGDKSGTLSATLD